METDFIVTDIKRVIMVGKDEYPEQITTFKHDLQSNELIFNFSGHSTVYFNASTQQGKNFLFCAHRYL